MNMGQIGAFEAKSQLSWLLDRVAAGESFTITKHGKPVAKLVPVNAARRATKPDVRTAIARLHKLSKGVRLGNIRLRDMIEEGRKS